MGTTKSIELNPGKYELRFDECSYCHAAPFAFEALNLDARRGTSYRVIRWDGYVGEVALELIDGRSGQRLAWVEGSQCGSTMHYEPGAL